ncbi:Transposable element P transposase, partial [Aphis craccivora]
MTVFEKKTVDGEVINIDVTNSIKFLNGWQITINALSQLCNDIQKPQFVLCTYKLNQDCLENLFWQFSKSKWQQ